MIVIYIKRIYFTVMKYLSESFFCGCFVFLGISGMPCDADVAKMLLEIDSKVSFS